MADLPIREAAALANDTINQYLVNGVRAEVFFKFTCAHCGARQTFDTPNVLYKEGECEESHQVTTITHLGFMLVAGHALDQKDEADRAAGTSH